MANNQQPGGNNMAAMLGNMRGRDLQGQGPQAMYGGGMQPPTQQTGVYRGPLDASGKPAQAAGTYEQMPGGTFGGQPITNTRYTPPGGWGAGMQPQGGPTPGFQNPLAGTADSMMQKPGGFQPMPSTGAPGGGKAAGGAPPQMQQAIGQLPGGPPSGAPGQGAGGAKGAAKQAMGQLPGGPRPGGFGGGMRPMQRPRPQGMQAPNPAMMRR